MTAYAPNFTARVRVKYRAAGAIHTQTWRCPGAGALNVNIGLLATAVEDIWGNLTPVLFDDAQCLAVTYAAENSNVFLPTSLISITGSIATPTDQPRVKALAVSLVGRTSGGQPAKEFFYGIDDSAVSATGGDDFRINPGENAAIDGAIAQANGFLVGLVMCGSDGQGVTWYPYANQKPNDYWVKRVRQGA